MAYRDSTTATRTGLWFSNANLTLELPTHAADDILMVALTIDPSAFERSRFGERFYRFGAPDGWNVLGDIEYGQIATPAHAFVFWRVATASEPASYTFNVSQTNELLTTGGGDTYTLSGIMAAYSGRDTERPINDNNFTPQLIDGLQLNLTRANSDALMFSFIYQGTLTHTALTERASVTDLQLEDETIAARGATGKRDFTAVDAIAGRCFVALTGATGGNEDPPPTGGTGKGAAYLETELRQPLQLASYRLNDASELELVDDDLECIAATVSFNSLGACIGGTIVIASTQVRRGLNLQPYSRYFELSMTPVTVDGGIRISGEPFIWYSGLLGAFPQVHAGVGFFQAPLIGLYDLVRQGVTEGNVAPSKAPFITSASNFNDGVNVDIVAGTVDDYQTWDEYLKQKYQGIPSAQWGVGSDKRFVRGRPQDGTPLVLDASAYNPLPAESGETEYVTGYYVRPDDDTQPVTQTATRDDLAANIPERVVSTELDGNGNAVIPAGFSMPVYQVQSFEFEYPGILIPPVLVTGLPNGKEQYVTEAQVNLEINGKKVSTRVRTENLIVRRD